MKQLKTLINEAIITQNLSKKGCGCGCNHCHINENTEQKTQIKNIIRKIINESDSTIIQLKGKLVADTSNRTQTDILSDIRSISGITIVSSKEYKSNDNATNNSHYHSIISVKIDPHPFIGKGGFGKEQIKDIILNIKKSKRC